MEKSFTKNFYLNLLPATGDGPLDASPRFRPRHKRQGKDGCGGKGQGGTPEKHVLSHRSGIRSVQRRDAARVSPVSFPYGFKGRQGAAVMQAQRLPAIVASSILCPSTQRETTTMAKEPTDIIHAALIHAAATLTAAKKEVMEKASPDEVKKHFKTFLHTLEAGWREHEAGDHHHS
ncbi:hypothetical protein AA16373_2852 [Komagataeibacter swingsii DSM 16373]|nr:hypothetical protein AA16373_2852 [Komagataeibacter swingsii DSM 16373]